MNKRSSFVRSAALAGAIALGATVAPMATAQTMSPTATPTVEPLPIPSDVDHEWVDGNGESSTIDNNRKGTLTIHKRANPAKTGAATGNYDPEVGGQTLEGVGFTIYKINDIDMTTNAGLAAAAKKTAEEYLKNGKADTDKVTAVGAERKTNGEGMIVLDNLAVGAYLVVETSPKEGYSPAAPFIAFVPMTQNNKEQGGTYWNYDVHAYPKNYSKTEPKKTVTDLNQNVGGTIIYDIKTQVRNIAEGKRLKYYFIEDTLDKKNLDVDKAKITVTKQDKNDGTGEWGESVELKEGSGNDYTLTWTTDDAGKRTGHFSIAFTKTGLQKLKSQTKVNVNVEATKITDRPVIPNEAFEYEPPNPSTDQDFEGGETPPDTPEGDGYETPPVFTRYGEVKFKKVDKDRNGLEGAEFKLFRIEDPNNDGKAVCPAEMPHNGALTAWDAADQKNDNVFNPATQEVAQEGTDSAGKELEPLQKGEVRIAGLHVNDFANNLELPSENPTINQSMYCLYETKAPKGKELLSKPISFKLVKGTGTHIVTKTVTKWHRESQDAPYTRTTETREYEVPVYEPQFLTVGNNNGEVVNLDDTTPNLPMTGGMGIGILAAIGAAIVGLGAWFARRSSAQN